MVPGVKKVVLRYWGIFSLVFIFGCSSDQNLQNCGIHDDPIPLEIQREVRRQVRLPRRGVISPLSSVPALNSRPGAPASLYINFVGETTPAWGAGGFPAFTNIVTPAYDLDGDPTTFQDSELSAITDIWGKVAQFYAPFNINVTTVAGSDPAKTMRVVVGGNASWYPGSAGGVAWTGSYRNSQFKVAFCFSALLGGNPKYVADVVAHEAGHAFGLGHQRLFDANGNMTNEYNPGANGIAPIMGVPYFSKSFWFYGTVYSPTNLQNDAEVLAGSLNAFGYAPDQFADAYIAHSALPVSGGVIEGDGTIEKTGDVDYLPFSSGSGSVDLRVSLHSSSTLFALVDLIDGAQNVISSSVPDGQGKVIIQTNLPSGFYALAIRGAVQPVPGPASIGAYHYRLTPVPGGPQGDTPESPYPSDPPSEPGLDESAICR